MRLKMLLLVVFAAGFAASIALAGDGRKHDHGHHNGNGCTEVHLSGTVAAQSLAVTVDHASQSGPAAGSVVTLALGGTGKTVRVNVEACMTGTGTTAQLAANEVELRVRNAQTVTTTTTTAATTTGATTTGATTTKKHDDDDDQGEHHGGATTTTAPVTTTTHR